MIMNYQKQWDFLKNKYEAGQLGHAYVLSGQNAESITHFAKAFLKDMNGFTGEQTMIDKGIFPDLKIVQSIQSDSSIKNEKDMLSIEIEQMRDVQHFLSLTAYYNGHKAVIIEHAERMTTDAQNCFLKSLEEPSGKTIIFLITEKSNLLLPTIFSRCQEIKFLGNSRINADSNADLRGNELSPELLNIINSDLAEKFQYTKGVNLEGNNFNAILTQLQQHFRNLLLAKIGVGGEVVTKYSIEKLKKIIRLIETIYYQSQVNNINNKLALEIVLLEM